MKLDFSKKTMDIGTFPFNLMRTLMVAGTGGADVNECLLVAEKIKDNNIESWVQEWAVIADQVAGTADRAAQSGQVVTARQAYLRASNYYRSAMFSLPYTDERLSRYLTLSRECFHQAARLSSPPVEVMDVPFGEAHLPGYFLPAGRAKAPTLIALNGGDSTNEEMVHWLGFAAVARGWNYLTFEGPGQWSALQLNPGLTIRPDYEAPLKVFLDYLVQREEVDPGKIALFGPSLGSLLAVRATAFEDRICACICSGLIADFYEGWHAVWPRVLQNASPGTFDAVFTGLEKVSPQLHGLANHLRWMMGVSKPHEIIEACRPFNVSDLAAKMRRPMLLLYGEGEAAQSNELVGLSVLRFISNLACPFSVRLFGFEEGWAATHCQVGALAPLQTVVFDWLDKAVTGQGYSSRQETNAAMDVFIRYLHSSKIKGEADELIKRVRAKVA